MTPDEEEKCDRDKIALLIDACNVATKQYEDYWSAFTSLDAKAMAIATISGIVLAAVVAFLKDGQAPAFARSNWVFMTIILAPPLIALVAVIASMLGARVTEVVEPFDAPERMREATNLAELDCEEFSRPHVADYYRAQLKHWSEAIVDIRLVVERKATSVLFGQWALIGALALLLVLFVAFLLAPSPTASIPSN